jgi:hypothetical protein
MSTALSIVALIVSVATAAYAGFVLRSVSNREITNTAITDYYASMRELTKLQLDEWRLAHLFEIETNYAAVAATLRGVAPAPSSADSVMLSLRERAAALTLFGLYEHVLYQMEEVANDGDTVRARFLRDAVTYFTQRLLPNPRRRYLWAEEGGNLECEFEENVRAHYKAHIEHPLDGCDTKGPYGAI